MAVSPPEGSIELSLSPGLGLWAQARGEREAYTIR